MSSWLLTSGLFITGLGGAFLPWIWRESVALQLTGPGLAEFVKFVPEVRTGQIQVERLHFLLPLFSAMLMLPLLAANKRLDLPVWLRQSLKLAVIPLALASLSPVWSPAILMNMEFRLQTIAALIAIVLALIAPIFGNLPLKALVAVSTVANIMAIGLAGRQFNLVQSAITAVYHEPIALGWGWWVTVAGTILTIIGGFWAARVADL